MRIKGIKKAIAVVMILCMTVSVFSGCGKKETQSKGVRHVSAEEVLCNVWAAAPMDGRLLCYLDEVSEISDFCDDIDMDQNLQETIAGMAVVRSFEASADMYIVLETTDTDSVKKALEEYKEIRTIDFTGYAPAEEAKLKDASVMVKNDIVALLVSENHDVVEKAFEEAVDIDFFQDEAGKEECLSFLKSAAENTTKSGFYNPNADSETVNETENEIGTEIETEIETETGSTIIDGNLAEIPLEDFTEGNGKTRLSDGTILIEEVDGVIEPIDTSNIVNAYKSGDTSGLNDRDLAVFEKAREIIDTNVNDGMSVVEKEKAIHDYLTQNTAYDKNCLIYSKWYTEYADQPYGCLILQQSICLGYATTFKMFMDMLDIECIIVKGQANLERGNHAWNMVHMDDGLWYTVDVTWDDPIGGEGLYYNFFNTTDDYMEATNHFWEREEYPVSKGGIYTGVYY